MRPKNNGKVTSDKITDEFIGGGSSNIGSGSGD
jgi:hypothetical protein